MERTSASAQLRPQLLFRNRLLHQTDFYTILQVKRNAALEEIKKKYNELILLLSP